MPSSSSDPASRPPVEFQLPAPEDTHVVVVDDEVSVLSVLSRALSHEGYSVETFDAAQPALEHIAAAAADVAVLISDIRMPELDGMELIRRALGENPNLAVIVLTGAAETATAVESLRLGVDDYLEKPVEVDGLLESVERALRKRAQSAYRMQMESWLRSEVERLSAGAAAAPAEGAAPPSAAASDDDELATLGALIRVLEARDPHLKGHSQRVATLAMRVARALGLAEDEVADVRVAGLLHDIGMIAVPETIVQKESQLSEDEYALVQRHVEVGAGILEPLPSLERAAEYMLCHHERLNGSGYPRGLKGMEIPLAAQVLGVAETYASLTEQRAYRRAYSAVDALDTLQRARDVWFEARVVDALEEVLQEEPTLRESG
jgi:putative two-component system response regulator